MICGTIDMKLFVHMINSDLPNWHICNCQGDTSNRKSIETWGYLICTRGLSPRVLIRLLSVLNHSLSLKHVPCCHNMKPRQKGTNERTSEYDISNAFPFSAVTICDASKNEPIKGHALECG
jgi:hypothetical protein